MISHYLFYFIELFLVVYNIITAKINSNMEKNDLLHNISGSIKHGWWGAAYIGLVLIAFYFTHYDWFLLVAALFQRKLVFDISYNLFQPRYWYFVDKESTAITDQVYNYIFQYNAKIYQPFNLIVFLVLQKWV